MLAAHWMEEGSPAGYELWEKLREHIPNARLSSPGLRMQRLYELEKDDPLVKSDADQWEWRMDPDHPCGL